MSLQNSINCIKNSTINKIVYTLENPSNYCWQEEMPEERKLNDIENIIDVMRKEIELTKHKYKNKEIQRENSSREN